MLIRGQFDPSDYLDAWLLHIRFPPTRIVVALGGVIGVLLGFVWWTGQGGAPGLACPVRMRAIQPLASLVGLLYAVVLANRYLLLPWRARRIFAQQKELHEPFAMEITSEGVRTENAFVTSRRPWDFYVRWRENERLLMLYHSDARFSMIPKRLLAEPGAQEAIREWLASHRVPRR